MTAEEFLKENTVQRIDVPSQLIGIGDAREYAKLFAIEQLEDLRKVFEMHEQNAASIDNTFHFKIEELKSSLTK